MPSYRKILSSLFASLGALVLIGAMAAPADAAQSDCPAGNVCAWENANYGGRFIAMRVGCADFRTCFASNFDNVATSFLSKGSTKFCFWSNPNYTGAAIALLPGRSSASIGGVFDNSMSSAHVADSTHNC